MSTLPLLSPVLSHVLSHVLSRVLPSCIGVAPHAFAGSVQLQYKVGEGATTCVKSSDELANDWRGIPAVQENTGDGSCVILNGYAHVLASQYSIFSYQVLTTNY